jgi:hypothetical protein
MNELKKNERHQLTIIKGALLMIFLERSTISNEKKLRKEQCSLS